METGKISLQELAERANAAAAHFKSTNFDLLVRQANAASATHNAIFDRRSKIQPADIDTYNAGRKAAAELARIDSAVISEIDFRQSKALKTSIEK